ncbi:MAG: hypothetical protein ACI9W4_001312 [Rhodothermales bacterium]|jgi:hypothetical protein
MGAKLVLGIALLAAGCAVPIPPSGGPADSQAPRVVNTEPADGAVRTRPDRIRIQFDEFIDPRSAATAVSVTPEPDRPPEIRPGGKSLDIIFREPLRDNTTYIVTVDTGLRDAHGVGLDAPIRVAFATGDQINRGRMAGMVARSVDGNADIGLDVYAWVVPDSLSGLPILERPPDYRTQTNQTGRFAFSYLQEASYFVMGLRDGNRNRTIDPGEDVAWPPLPLVDAAGDSLSSGTWISTRLDTTAATLRRVASLSSTRLALSVDEPVSLVDRDVVRWELLDTLSLQTVSILDVFQPHDDARRLVVLTEPLTGDHWEIWGDRAAADSAGNSGTLGPMAFLTSAAVDTFRTRFLGFEADTVNTGGLTTLLPGTLPRLLFSAPLNDRELRRGVSVSDSSGARNWTWSAPGGTRVTIDFGGGESATIEVDLAAFSGPDSVASLPVTRSPDRILGEIGGVILPGAFPIVVEARSDRFPAVLRARPDSAGSFAFTGLPDDAILRLRFFEDRDGDEAWDFGSLNPFQAPERLGWLEASPPVRARWETVIPDTLRLIELLPPLLPASAAADSSGLGS